MKLQLFIIGLLLFFSFSVFAQTEQGSKFIGGSFQISTTTNSFNDNTSTSFTLSPKFGYFLQDRWAIGSGLGLSITSNGDTDVTFTISPFTRYYIPLIEEKFFAVGEAGLSVGFGTDTSFGIYAAPGFAFFPTERWSIELAFNLLSFNITNPDGDNNTTTSFSFGTNTYSPSLGVNFFF
jgi:hypothetical protein